MLGTGTLLLGLPDVATSVANLAISSVPSASVVGLTPRPPLSSSFSAVWLDIPVTNDSDNIFGWSLVGIPPMSWWSVLLACDSFFGIMLQALGITSGGALQFSLSVWVSRWVNAWGISL